MGLLKWVARNDIKKVNEILKSGGDPNIIISDRTTFPLRKAAENGNLTMVKLLIHYGADPKKMVGNGVTAFYQAVAERHFHVADYLYDIGCDIENANEEGLTDFLAMAFEGNTKSMYYLKEKGANIQHQDNEGKSAMHIAIVDYQANVLEEAIKMGVNSDLKYKGLTAFQIAALNEYLEMIDIFKKYEEKLGPEVKRQIKAQRLENIFF